jgi:hypothetical protein
MMSREEATNALLLDLGAGVESRLRTRLSEMIARTAIELRTIDVVDRQAFHGQERVWKRPVNAEPAI